MTGAFFLGICINYPNGLFNSSLFAFFRFDHGLKTFFLSSDVLLNACIPTTHVPFGTFLNVAVTVPSLRFSFL